MKRYLGAEDCRSPKQVVDYLVQNYVDRNGDPMPAQTAQSLVEADAARIADGISVFRSYVRYLGDQALAASGDTSWTELPEPEDEDYDDIEGS